MFKVGDVVQFKDTEDARYYYDRWFHEFIDSFDGHMVVRAVGNYNTGHQRLNFYDTNLVCGNMHVQLACDKNGQMKLPFGRMR